MKRSLFKPALGALSFLTMAALLHGDVTSTQGQIKLDVNDDQNEEVMINTIGLGIGVTPSSANLEVAGNAIVSQKLTVGSSTTGSSNLNITGTWSMSYQSLTNDGTATSSIVLVDTSSGNYTVSLPDPDTVDGRIIKVKQTYSSGNFTLDSLGAGQVEGQATITLHDNSGYAKGAFIASGGNWHQLSGTVPQ